MSELYLDYQRRPRSSPWSGLALLMLALAAALASGIIYADLNEQADRIDASIEKMEGALHANARDGHSGGREAREMALEIKLANEAIAQLSWPWESLFQAVESCGGKDVSLLGLEPNTGKHQVKISGEAKNIAAMLDYAERLEKREVFGTVYLLNHHIQQQDAEKPVRFSVIAVWKAKL